MAKGKGENIFQLRSDFTGIMDDTIYVMDAKWKLIDENNGGVNYGVNQSDMYQLFSYGKIYWSQEKRPVKLWLFFPKTKDFEGRKQLYIRIKVN